MSKAQESFGATTSLTLACKRLAHEMVKSGMSDEAAAMAQQGARLCKDPVGPTEEVERILMSPRESLTREGVITTLRTAAVRTRTPGNQATSSASAGAMAGRTACKTKCSGKAVSVV